MHCLVRYPVLCDKVLLVFTLGHYATGEGVGFGADDLAVDFGCDPIENGLT